MSLDVVASCFRPRLAVGRAEGAKMSNWRGGMAVLRWMEVERERSVDKLVIGDLEVEVDR